MISIATLTPASLGPWYADRYREREAQLRADLAPRVSPEVLDAWVLSELAQVVIKDAESAQYDADYTDDHRRAPEYRERAATLAGFAQRLVAASNAELAAVGTRAAA